MSFNVGTTLFLAYMTKVAMMPKAVIEVRCIAYLRYDVSPRERRLASPPWPPRFLRTKETSRNRFALVPRFKASSARFFIFKKTARGKVAAEIKDPGVFIYSSRFEKKKQQRGAKSLLKSRTLAFLFIPRALLGLIHNTHRVVFSPQDALSADGNANLPCLAMALMMMAWYSNPHA